MDVRERIRQELEAQGQSPRAISLKAGLSDSMLHKFLTGQTRSITIETLEAIAGALGVSLRYLMFGDPDNEKVAYIWDHIPERRRKQALQVLGTFADDDTESQAG